MLVLNLSLFTNLSTTQTVSLIKYFMMAPAATTASPIVASATTKSIPQQEEDVGPFTGFPGTGLRPARRFITGHNKEGKGIFIKDDDGDHHRVMVRGKGVSNIIYSTEGNPVDMNDDVDVEYAKNNEVCYP